jgi:hypothetical protein
MKITTEHTLDTYASKEINADGPTPMAISKNTPVNTSFRSTSITRPKRLGNCTLLMPPYDGMLSQISGSAFTAHG